MNYNVNFFLLLIFFIIKIKRIKSFETGSFINQIAFSVDGSEIASATNRKLSIYRVFDLHKLSTLSS
jgi:hypothetical protein